ncbi:hypothetical protein [Taklimakanibacter lacteus]|uniref:hypothetical protein n=1 Tax=Taklimakanibacter lacteus TaxID=2268456 RepID=UPI000E66BD3D
MTDTRSPEATETPLSRDILYALRYYLGGRGLIALATIALATGLAFNWSWLVAAGIAPLLITALPCLVMCALGLCVNRMAGRSCATEAAAEKTLKPSAVEVTAPVSLAEPPAETECQASVLVQLPAALREPESETTQRSMHDA